MRQGTAIHGLIILTLGAVGTLVPAGPDEDGPGAPSGRQDKFGSRRNRPDETHKRADSLRIMHASLAAYGDAAIAFKAPKTGMIFYVESNGRRLAAIDRDGALAWVVDVQNEAGIDPIMGEPVIRHLKLTPDGDRLRVTFGKHAGAELDVRTGELKIAGQD